MTTGYKTITPTPIGNLIHALAARRVPWLAARVWFACLEMLAIREAAARVRRQRRDTRKILPAFQRAEICEFTGLGTRAVARALGSSNATACSSSRPRQSRSPILPSPTQGKPSLPSRAGEAASDRFRFPELSCASWPSNPLPSWAR